MKTRFTVTITETYGMCGAGNRYDTAVGHGSHRSVKRAVELAKEDQRVMIRRRYKTDPCFLNGCPVFGEMVIKKNGREFMRECV